MFQLRLTGKFARAFVLPAPPEQGCKKEPGSRGLSTPEVAGRRRKGADETSGGVGQIILLPKPPRGFVAFRAPQTPPRPPEPPNRGHDGARRRGDRRHRHRGG